MVFCNAVEEAGDWDEDGGCGSVVDVYGTEGLAFADSSAVESTTVVFVEVLASRRPTPGERSTFAIRSIKRLIIGQPKLRPLLNEVDFLPHNPPPRTRPWVNATEYFPIFPISPIF